MTLPSSATPPGQSEHQALQNALQASQIRVVGHQDIFDLAEIRLMTTVLLAYGNSSRGFLYAEPGLLNAQIPPPDLVLAHPSVGLMVFECKAYTQDFIYGMEAGSLKIMRHGREQLVNPLRQAQRGMFAIKDGFERFAHRGPRPLFHAMVALPNIDEAEWQRLGYDRFFDSRVLLFQEHIQDPDRLQARISALVDHTRQRTQASTPLSPDAETVLLRVFGDSSVMNDARQAMRDLDAEHIGAQIDILENRLRHLSPEQERLSRLNTWGHPFLVRGVAGSGKSIVLANQVARTLYRFHKQQAQLPLFEDLAPDVPRIGVICFNRTLVALLHDRIVRAYHALTGQDLPANLLVTDLNGLLFQLAQKTRHFKYISTNKTRHPAERARKHLEQLEKLRLEHADVFEQARFDGVFIDEGQDAHPDEYLLIRTLVRPDRQTREPSITIFYDDAQNVYGHPPPVWRDLSLNIAGGRAVFMQESYRNSREILTFGMNILLGTHARHRQRVATRRFLDVHTLQEKELIEEAPGGWQVNFAQPTGIAPTVKGFRSRFEQLDWVAEAALALITQEHVRPEHIVILAPTATPFRYLSQRITQLANTPLPLRVVGGSYQQFLDRLLIMPGHLTLATIYAAKGYDAPIAFLVDTDQLGNGVVDRARFYVGITRAKRYLIVTGLDLPNTLLREALAEAERYDTRTGDQSSSRG
ncbi:MAG: ATP-binding domain-containing protein [Chloroflexi bacterium]|nr:ATP-binding domain-containing protein [Chloroflexota bacterium]